MKKLTFNESVKLFKRNWEKSNKLSLDNFEHCQKLLAKEIWKTRDYYETEDLYNKFHNCSFDSFLIGAFDLNFIWYENMVRIMSLDDGKEVFIERGFRDTVTYYNMADDIRKPCLDYVRNSDVYKTLREAKNDLYPNEARKKKEKKLTNVVDKKEVKKISKLEKELAEKDKRIAELEEENKRLKESVMALATGKFINNGKNITLVGDSDKPSRIF